MADSDIGTAAPDLKDPARAILAGHQATVDEIVEMSDGLKAGKDFELARRLLTLARERGPHPPELERRLREKLAICIYKDPELRAEDALDEALAMLDVDGDLDASNPQETLGIAGAIHKRRWEVDGRVEHLHRALEFYQRGWELRPRGDYRYTGINTAYVLDLLAHLDEQEGDGASQAKGRRREKARTVRLEIADELEGMLQRGDDLNWWSLATLVEAHFGLGNDERARELLEGARPRGQVDDWELESTARQLASLARITRAPSDRQPKRSDVAVLKALIGGEAEHVVAAFGGKLGVALSGGGFRASFFHLGVLAALAELDVLRHVEVLSCVSGGSIAGAQYYLRLRRLLADTPDGQVDREALIGVVRQVQEDFVGGVDANIRAHVLVSSFLRWARPGRTRTTRVAELLDTHLFSRVDGIHGRPLRDLIVQPPDAPVDFNPKRHNWSRSTKVPVLILNATTLNTGHNWQFAATWMCEPPSTIEGQVDIGSRLQRMWLKDEVPAANRDITLSTAVAASACVPGLFPPVPIEGLYQDIVVRLVDGGLQDNQGSYGLLDQDCRLVFVSDASAQKDTKEKRYWRPWSVLLRSNTIAMGTIRTRLYRELDSLHRSSRLNALWYVHLGRGLDRAPVAVAGAKAPAPPAHAGAQMTPYGIPAEVQRRLMALRTDLDRFSADEADALMLSGYKMANWCLKESGHPLVAVPNQPADFRFRRMDRVIGVDAPREEYERLLDTLDDGSHRWFRRTYRLRRQLRRRPSAGG